MILLCACSPQQALLPPSFLAVRKNGLAEGKDTFTTIERCGHFACQCFLKQNVGAIYQMSQPLNGEFKKFMMQMSRMLEE